MVVVEHGKNGKKDKYYIIPAGAPVIFEDENGNELTRYVYPFFSKTAVNLNFHRRVGDFSGRYKPPRRLRPVIVQDQYGREICRYVCGKQLPRNSKLTDYSLLELGSTTTTTSR